MARGLNKVTLIGTLGQDPELKTSGNGGSITRISIATNQSWKDKQSGETKTHTEWHRVVFFGNLAGIANQYLKKGSLVYIEGKIKKSKYNDKDGIEKYSFDILADQMQMLDKKSEGSTNKQPEQKVKHADDPKKEEPMFDDDVPF